MPSQPREMYEAHKEAIAMYEDIKERMNAKTLKINDVLFYYTEYQKAIQDTPIFDIIHDLIATASLGITQESEPVNNATTRYVINENPIAAFGGDHVRRIQASYDLVALYEECVKLFSNKITPVKLNQKFAFQTKYFYAFDNGLDCNFIITKLSQEYNDNGLTCQNQGDFYQMLP